VKHLLFSVTKNDFTIQTFRSGGKGGQHHIHRASGATGESRKHRSQHRNKTEAFSHLCNSPKFRRWLRIEAAKKLTDLRQLEERVEEQMRPENLKVEGFDGAKWYTLGGNA